ncbi:hypothetical protein [Pantoea piersonii]|uniref:hypothetical protein n=1 Tax=Pantoea piersonii TaxID=2364647 RepID=UPI0028A250D5|nr:hypothetical protein [Pantoea piersonii]
MEIDILYFKVSDKVIVFPETVDFVGTTTFPHEKVREGIRYAMTKYEYEGQKYLIGCSGKVPEDELNAAIKEFKPSPL